MGAPGHLFNPTNDDAASFVVGNGGDYPLTEAGLNAALAALPAAGGWIVIREGTLTLSATVTLPNKPVRISGSGPATIISIAAVAIPAFTLGSAQAYFIDDLVITGTLNTASQEAFRLTASAVLRMFRVQAQDVRTFIKVTAGAPLVSALYCTHNFTAADTSSNHWDGAGTMEFDHFNAEVVPPSDTGGIIGSPTVRASYSRFGLGFASGAVGFSQFLHCFFYDGYLTIGAQDSEIGGCVFDRGTENYRIVLAAGIDYCSIWGNLMTDYALAAISVASNRNHIFGNRHCAIIESGAANGNLYEGNTGMVGSVFIGEDSVINGCRRIKRTAQNTTDAYVTVADYINNNAIGPVHGWLLNSGGVNGLTIKETWVDCFGNTGTVTTNKAAGTVYVIDADANYPGAVTRPFIEYKIEVKAQVAASQTTYQIGLRVVGSTVGTFYPD